MINTYAVGLIRGKRTHLHELRETSKRRAKSTLLWLLRTDNRYRNGVVLLVHRDRLGVEIGTTELFRTKY